MASSPNLAGGKSGIPTGAFSRSGSLFLDGKQETDPAYRRAARSSVPVITLADYRFGKYSRSSFTAEALPVLTDGKTRRARRRRARASHVANNAKKSHK